MLQHFCYMWILLVIICCGTDAALIERWETVPVPPDTNPLIPDGCYDVKANKHTNGEIYQRPEKKFKYICVDGEEQVFACIGSARTNFAEIPVGGTLNVNAFWHKCTKNYNSSVTYTQEFSCKYKDKEYKIGDEINLGFMHLRCEQDGYKVEGCFFRDENGGLTSTAQNGDAFGAHKKGASCKPHVPVPNPTDGGCVRSGKIYHNGETFEDSRIQYKCSKGVTDPIGCYMDKERILSIGEDFIDKRTVYRCFRTGGSIHFLEYDRGLPGSPASYLKPIGDDSKIRSRTLGKVLATQP